MPAQQQQRAQTPASESPICHNCGMAIPWWPVMREGAFYCCPGCAQGGPCYCSYDLPPATESGSHRAESVQRKHSNEREGVHR